MSSAPVYTYSVRVEVLTTIHDGVSVLVVRSPHVPASNAQFGNVSEPQCAVVPTTRITLSVWTSCVMLQYITNKGATNSYKSV